MVHLPGGITLDVTLRNRSIGELSTAIALDFDGGEAHLVSEGAELFSGYVMWSGDPMAHRIEANGPGRVRLTEIDAKDIACSSRMPNGELRGGIPLPPGIDPDAPPPAAAAAALGPVAIPPPLDSVPGSTAVIYLDFDGQTVTGTPWNTAYTSGAPIVAEPSTLSDNTIHGVWKRVAEDFAPFNISVTNIESRYLNAPQNRRIRIIITPSYEWYGTGAGGVAYYGSFRNSGDTPAWVFESRVGYTEKNVSEVCSHEAGHTFDLRHDGLDVADEEYYSGHGTGATSWAPIMGVGYSRTIVQWSKGDYYDANRTEDDLALIASASNGISFRVDQYANTTASAQTISHNAQTGAVNVSGVIETGSDADVFRIPAFGGPLSLVVSMTGQSDSPSPNMDVRAELLNSAGVVIETANPAGAATATINRNLTTGTYYLRVSGSNFGSPLAANPTGYTDYGSIGQYWITGNFNTIPPPPPTDLDPASDSGVSNSDNLTKITTPTFNGTANAGGANIFLTSSLDGVVGTAPVNGSGNYTVVSSTLREGIHSMTVRQGTGPESAELVVTIDTTASVPQRPDLTDPTDSGFSNTDNITNITNPMFFVTSETGGFTELLRNGIVVGSATSTGADIINPGVFSEGAHTITARSTDRAGNTSGASLPLNVTIDTTPPAVPQQPDLTSASDSGVSNTDNLTNVAIPSFVTVSEPGNLIELLANGAVVGGATSTGTNTITSSALTDGLKSITARTTDVAGNVSAPSASLAVTIDTTAPIPPTAMRVTAATDTGLSQSDNITSNTNPVISGNSEAGAKVYVTVDGVAAGSHPTGGSWTLPLTSLANGVRLVRARAEDPAGNLGFDSAALSVTIDTIPPAAPTALRLSPATDTGISNTDNLTRLNNPSLIGSAENGARVTIFRDGVSQGTANSGGTWAFATSGLAEGIHAYSARQTDPAGNDGPLSGAVNISVDLTPPAPASAPLLNPSSDTGASNSDRVTRLQSLVFSGSSEAGGRVTLLAGATPLGTTGSNGAWSLTSAPIIAGTHLIRARAEDAAGNEALEDSPPTEVTIVLSAAPPANVRLDPSSDLGFSDTDAITSDTTPLIAGDSPAGSTIQLSIGDPPSEIPLGSGPGGPGWTVQSGLLPAGDGFKTIKAKVLDLAGNLSAAATVQIEIRTSTPAAPIGLNLKVGSDTGASATDKITRINTPTVTGLVNLGGRPSVRIRLESNGQLVGLATTTTQSWEVVTDPLPDGVHEIRARSEDFAGNLSAPSTVPMTVTIDTVAPAAPGTLRVAEDDDTGFSSSDNVTRITRPRIVGIAEPGPVVLFINGNQHPGTLDSDGTWSYRPDAPLPEGVTQFRARQSDLAGNQGPDSATLAVTIDTTPPPAGPISPPRLHPASDLGPLDNDRVTADNTPLLFGTTGPGEVATLVIDGTESGSVVADGTGAWTFESPELPDGPHSIVARRSDLAGNLGATSAPLNLTIDTNGPLVSISRAAGQASTTVGEPIRFAVAFTQPVFGFGSGDVSVTGAAGLGSMVTVIGADGGTDYLVEVAGTTGEGLVRVDIPAGGATDLAGNPHPVGDGPDNEVLKKQLPGPVSGVNATRDVFPDKVVVTWHSLAGATGYRIFRHAFASPGAAVQVASVAGDVGEFEDTSVPPGIWHSYWVRAEDEDGVGAFGVPASGRAEDAAGDSKRAETPISEAATAPLIDMPWDDAAAGLFEGLVRDAADGRTQVGVVERMVVSRPRAGSGLGGAASATLRMNGRAASLRGVFDATGHLTADLRQKDGSRIIADLRLMEPTGVGGETIVGTISWHGATALADLPRSPYHAKSHPVPTAIAGAHTMILPALPGWGVDEPGGDGWATVNIAAGGLITVAGNLGDGTKFSESAHLSGEAEPAFSLFAQLYRSVPLTGHLGGRLTLRNQPDISDFDGVLRWLKFPDQREARYQGRLRHRSLGTGQPIHSARRGSARPRPTRQPAPQCRAFPDRAHRPRHRRRLGSRPFLAGQQPPRPLRPRGPRRHRQCQSRHAFRILQ
jgi:hypothetical protein